VTKLTLHAAGLVKPARGRSVHRKKRQRRPLPGMMLHQDGSRHVWIEGRPPMDLIVTLDDATSEIYSMILLEEEGTASTFRALREVIPAHGLFCALYTDRGAHYFHTPKGGERASRTHKTQVGRALAQLGIEHIASYSPGPGPFGAHRRSTLDASRDREAIRCSHRIGAGGGMPGLSFEMAIDETLVPSESVYLAS
jgi:hypothetical protein